MKTVIQIALALLIITVTAEYLLNRSSSTGLNILFFMVLFSTIYFLTYKPFRVMKNFIFIQDNGNGVLILSAPSFEEAHYLLIQTVKHPADWRVEDEEGEERE